MIDDSYFEEDVYQFNNTINIKKIVYIVLAVILAIVVIVIISSFANNSDTGYSIYERNLVAMAKDYIKENVVNTNNEIYIDSVLLNAELPDNCSISSGVIYYNGDYKPYLLCDDYESKVLNNNGSIKLNGKEVILLPRGMNYTDPGYSSNNKVKVTSLVGKEAGVYNVYYSLENSNDVTIRKVIIVDNPELVNFYPIMSLNGDELEVLKLNETYQDRGAVAMDKREGNLTSKIQVDGIVNTSVAGEYTLSYSVSNSLGYTNSLKRQVIVTDDDSDLIVLLGVSDDSLTNTSVNIIVNIIGNDYQYTILPNEEETYDKGFSYPVDSNGKYKFRIYSNTGNYIEKEIEVNNIFNEKPNASCSAILYNDKTDILVSSGNNIVGYRYRIDNSISFYSISNTYIAGPTSSNNISVDIRDILGNENTIQCSITNNKVINPTFTVTDPSIGNKNVKYYVYKGVEYVIPITKNDLNTFISRTKNRISQSATTTENNVHNCETQCLGFAGYHAAFLQNGNISRMTFEDACNYNYTSVATYKIIFNATKKDALKTVYDEILNGRVSVLQVSGNRERTRRHFYTVVGYRRDKFFASNLSEEDLLCIDAWTGNFATLSYSDYSKRTMYNNKDKYGYRVNVFSWLRNG